METDRIDGRQEHRSRKKRMDTNTDIDVLIKCLKYTLSKNDRERDESKEFVPPPFSSVKKVTPNWSLGTVTDFFSRHGFLKPDPADQTLINALSKPPATTVHPKIAEQRVIRYENNKFRRRFSPPRLIEKRKREEDHVTVPGVNANPVLTSNPFKTAREQFILNDRSKGTKRSLPSPPPRSPPRVKVPQKNVKSSDEEVSENPEVIELMKDERMKNVDPKMVEAVLNEVIEVGSHTQWDDIAGLNGVKGIIKEIIIWPMLRPDIFKGLRGPPKGILLFGPPGTGKTMIGRLIATQSNSTFFNISASSLTSKWIGDGEKMVRTLFQVARVKQPSVIFIDEIDSILTQRSDTEHESSRRLKTEFLIQFDGCGSKTEDQILVIGVTNRPQELDEAARRRLVKRIYIPLPDSEGRRQLVERLVSDQDVNLNSEDYDKISEISEGYSGADMASLCKEAAYGPIRDIGHDIQNISVDKVRPMNAKDFISALKHVKASVKSQDLSLFEDWDKQFGCHSE